MIVASDVIERMARARAARARAARADRAGSVHPAVAAMMAGAGAQLVASQHLARTILAERVRQAAVRRRADKEAPADLGGRPVATPLPDTSKPAAVTAGALSRKPETRGE
ncbi:hypothetical protein F4693_003541 [Sphingomonas endophytica]|uniref:Uncharacterized protein n=1 Tax=Sphingomonas endophytica TaxID=869719 RepID=A0A7X0MRJ4_9SPHN|nr:hypothetical protein [Sphingomonas endophytica]MBB6506538.1 hypothetical protein [Sphingomonas endophytica]